jgi:hypothetical protein
MGVSPNSAGKPAVSLWVISSTYDFLEDAQEVASKYLQDIVLTISSPNKPLREPRHLGYIL